MESIVGTTSELIRQRARLSRVVAVLTLLVVAATVMIALAVLRQGEGTATSTRTTSTLEQLVNAGLVPAETLQPAHVTGRSLYSARDRALMAAVAAGQVPEEALQSEHFLILRLINQGLIPRETVAS